jgi:hypothetical protein
VVLRQDLGTGAGGGPVTTLYVNVWYAGANEVTAAGFERAALYLEGLLAKPAPELVRTPIDRPRSPLVEPALMIDFQTRQKLTD